MTGGAKIGTLLSAKLAVASSGKSSSNGCSTRQLRRQAQRVQPAGSGTSRTCWFRMSGCWRPSVTRCGWREFSASPAAVALLSRLAAVRTSAKTSGDYRVKMVVVSDYDKFYVGMRFRVRFHS
jgi:hypothetical protein